MLSRISMIVGLALLVLAAYLFMWPVPIRPVSWAVPVAPGYAGAHAANQRLAGLQVIDLGAEDGPEHVAFGPDGMLYAAVTSGALLRMNADGSAQQVFARTGGRVLGFDFDVSGNLIAADAFKGLLQITRDGQVRVLTDRVGGDPIRYADAVIVARSGVAYFTDASTRFGPLEWGGTFEASILDIIEQSATGRVLAYDPGWGTTRAGERPASSRAACPSPTASRCPRTSSGSSSPRPGVIASGRSPPRLQTWTSRAARRRRPGCCWTTCPATPIT